MPDASDYNARDLNCFSARTWREVLGDGIRVVCPRYTDTVVSTHNVASRFEIKERSNACVFARSRPYLIERREIVCTPVQSIKRLEIVLYAH